MANNLINNILVIIVSIVVLTCSIGIIIATNFQNKSKKKYKEVINIINQKKDAKFELKNGLSEEDINNIDPNIDMYSLMKELYDTYLCLEDKYKNLDENLDDVLIGVLKETYLIKIKSFKEKDYKDITDGIDLIEYSITEFQKNILKFRVRVNCFNYKLINNEIVSGNNLKKIEEIICLTYSKVDDKWLISGYDKLYSKKWGN